MNDSARLKLIRKLVETPEEDLEQRLIEVQNAISKKLPDAEKLHFERELILQILKNKDDFCLQQIFRLL